MVQKKRKSKRLTPRTRHKRIKQNIKEQRKKQTTKPVKVPSSFLQTDEEKQIAEQIKQQARLRKKNYDQAVVDKILSVRDDKMFEECNVFVQVVDSRDVSSYAGLNLNNDNVSDKITNIVFLSKTDLVPNGLSTQWSEKLLNQGIICFTSIDEILSHISQSHLNPLICLTGHKNAGKSTLLQLIKEKYNCLSTENKYKITEKMHILTITKEIEPQNIDLSTVLRNAVSLDKIDVEHYIGETLKYLDAGDLSLVYNLPDFTSHGDFMKLLAEKYGTYTKKRILDLVEAGRRFLRDCCSGRIPFFRDVEGKLVFNLEL